MSVIGLSQVIEDFVRSPYGAAIVGTAARSWSANPGRIDRGAPRQLATDRPPGRAGPAAHSHPRYHEFLLIQATAATSSASPLILSASGSSRRISRIVSASPVSPRPVRSCRSSTRCGSLLRKAELGTALRWAWRAATAGAAWLGLGLIVADDDPAALLGLIALLWRWRVVGRRAPMPGPPC